MMLSWIDRANAAPTLIERMRALLRADDAISFAELDRLDGFRGHHQVLTAEGYANLILWPAISEAGAAALAEMIARGECHIGPASLLTYMADGRMPTLPIAKRRSAYTSPHWAPGVLLRGSPKAAKPRCHPRPATPARPQKRRLVPGKLRTRR